MQHDQRYCFRKRDLGVVAMGIVFVLTSVSRADFNDHVVYQGDNARQVSSALQAGGWCVVTTSVVNPTTNVVEQQFCRCVSHVFFTGGTADNPAIGVDFGPEAPCAGSTQQQAAAQQRIAQIDNAILQWDYYLQHLYDWVDPWAYKNDPTYRANYDAWVQQQSAQGSWYRDQLRAERQSLDRFVRRGPVSPGGAGGAGGGDPGGGSGILGIPMESDEGTTK